MKEVVKTDQAPEALGPYSQAIKVKCGRMVFCSGQIGLDPETGELVASDVARQADRALKNLNEVLGEAGATMADVVKTTIYLADISEFATVNEVYGAYFRQLPPARATVESPHLPKGARIEIEAVAVVA